MIKYLVCERGTDKQIGKPYTDRKRARARVDKLDLQYGCYHYYVKRIEETA